MATAQTQSRDSRRQELAIAALLLLAEKRNRRGLRAALRLPLSFLALGAGPSHIEQAVRVAGVRAILNLRTGTQKAARQSWGTHSGVAPTLAPIASWTEDARATRYGHSLADQWAKKFEKAREDGLKTPAAIRRAFVDLDPAIERTAITESVHAWNEETARQDGYAHSLGYVVDETWSAFLDQRTCPACESLDGTHVTRPDRFESEPPLHFRCRCFIVSFVESAVILAA